MKILLYTDCMSFNPEVEEALRYPALLAAAFPDCEIKTFGLSGMTTIESVENAFKIVEEKPDFVVFGFGVNDALPRGLKRTTRASIIRFSYTVHMSKQMRLLYRKYFLNPLEYIMQLLSKPKHYQTTAEMISNIDKCISLFRENGIKTVLINIAPVLNYRFIHGNEFIKIYNEAIGEYCRNNDIRYVDAFELFCKIGMEKALNYDKFHYSYLGHKAVAESLIENINAIKE